MRMKAAAKEQQKVTISDITAILKLSKPQISAILREMTNDGIIKKIGDNRYTYYVLNK